MNFNKVGKDSKLAKLALLNCETDISQGKLIPKNVSLLFINDHFEDKHNEASGLYRQTLTKIK